MTTVCDNDSGATPAAECVDGTYTLHNTSCNIRCVFRIL